MDFDNISDGTLRLILRLLNERSNEEDVDIVNGGFNEGVVSFVEDSVKYFGFDNLSIQEISFFFELVIKNPNYENTDLRIIRPKLKSYSVTTTEDAVRNVDTTYKNIVDSYIKVDKNYIEFLTGEGHFDYYEGDILDEYNYDGYVREVTTDEIKEIDNTIK
jgi:hypothetical protein